MDIEPLSLLEEIFPVLIACDLPISDICAASPPQFFGCRVARDLVAVIGLEQFQSAGLLRSLAVLPRYRGRGFIQLTGRSNYRRYGAQLQPAIDLEAHPELANAADVAADLLCLFLADRELLIKDALLAGNFQAARRLVNGGRHGLAEFTQAYQAGDALLAQP